MKRLYTLLHNRDGLARQLVEITLGSAGVRVAGMLVSFLVGVQLARYLGPSGYGVYGFVIAAVTIASVVATLGVSPATTREATFAIARREWATLNGLLIWSVLMVATVATIAAAVGYLGHSHPRLADPTVSTPYTLGLILIPLYALTGLGAAQLRGVGAIVGGQALDMLARPALFSICLFVVWQMYGLITPTAALVLQIVSCLVSVAIAGFWILHLRPAEARNVAPQYRTKAWLNVALPMGLTDILRAIDGNFAIVLLGAIVSASDLGIFRVGLASVAIVALPYALFGTVGVPIAARLHAAGDKRRLQLMATAISLAMFAASAVMTFVLWVAGEPLVSTIFGAGFAGAWEILMILCATQVLNSAMGISPALLNATGHELFLSQTYMAALMVTVAATIVLAQLYGAAGAAWATFIGAAFRALLQQIGVVRRLEIEPSILSARLYLRRSFVP